MTLVADSAGEGTPAASGTPISVLTFAIDEQLYGVDIMTVREIKGWSKVTQLPKQPDFVRGILNLRGTMVPIVDLRQRFGQGLTEPSPLHVVTIVQVGQRQVGLMADRVLDIVTFDSSQVQPVPHVALTEQSELLSGLVTIEGQMIALIDLTNLITSKESADSALGIAS
jgi:purine-binding chemotaxis protein CheW